jgi:predicted AAA+ superfamily ATPase
MVLFLMIKRLTLDRQIQQALKRSRVVALIGPRQCGKTTLDGTLVLMQLLE